MFDSKSARYYNSADQQSPLLFDFQDAKYIEIAVLVNCIAAILQRKELNLKTYLGYPKLKRVRDFLQVWRFREAVEQVCHLGLREFLLSEDLQYLEEKHDTYTGVGDGLDALEYDADWDQYSDTKRNFFEFTTFFHPERKSILPEGVLSAAPRVEGKRWTGTLISQVLAKHLGSGTPREDIARVIIYEAMSNAVRHPKANIIQVVSKFERARKRLGPPEESREGDETQKSGQESLRICVWDDGESITSTLMKPLILGRSVRSVVLPGYMYDRLRVDLRTFDMKVRRKHIVDQWEEPTKDTPEARLLLSSLFPGISRTIEEDVPEVEEYYVDEPTSYLRESASVSGPGMGLYALVRTALDQFQGTLFIRSGRYRLQMEIASDLFRRRDNVRYRSKITQYPISFPPFRGNLLIIQLPIKKSA